MTNDFYHFTIEAAGLDFEVTATKYGALHSVYLNGLLMPQETLCMLSITRNGAQITLFNYLAGLVDEIFKKAKSPMLGWVRPVDLQNAASQGGE